jgi:hypothetical protein
MVLTPHERDKWTDHTGLYNALTSAISRSEIVKVGAKYW